jgi:hypothetical protein
MTIEPNTIKRRGTGFRGIDPQRAFPGFTLFAPTSGNMVYLVDMQGRVEHRWQMPYTAQYGYLTERGRSFTTEDRTADARGAARPVSRAALSWRLTGVATSCGSSANPTTITMAGC